MGEISLSRARVLDPSTNGLVVRNLAAKRNPTNGFDLSHVSFKMKRGELCYLLGNVGCGKVCLVFLHRSYKPQIISIFRAHCLNAFLESRLLIQGMFKLKEEFVMLCKSHGFSRLL